MLMVAMVLNNAQKEPNDLGSIKNIDQKLEAALSAGDSAVLDQIVAGDYVEINAQGEKSNKVQVLAGARARSSPSAGVSVGPEVKVTEQTIRMHGNTAVVLSLISTRYRFMVYQKAEPPTTQDPETIDQERRMRVYSRSSSGWQLVAQQTTSIPKRD